MIQTLNQWLKDKRIEPSSQVLIREDFNLPMAGGKILSDARLRAALPTLAALKKAGAGVVILSHLGRPQEGQPNPAYSLAPVAKRLSELLNQEVTFLDWPAARSAKPGEFILMENVRFLAGETSNDIQVAKRLATLGTIFVMDAFASAHRAHASTVGVAQVSAVALAGPLLEAELQALDKVLKKPKHPVVSIIGGAKISGKIDLLERLLSLSDTLIVGGGIANTFIAAQGHNVGRSLYEPDQVSLAKALLKKAKARKWSILVPTDAIVAQECANTALPQIKKVYEVKAQDRILDVGPSSTALYAGIIGEAKTILWNGPMGAFEYKPFAAGTQLVAKLIADSDGYSVVGGGETLSALERAGVSEWISYVSTGGGAFLAYCEGQTLPGIAALDRGD